MLTLPICIIVLLPQAMADSRQKGPAVHLTLLLLSICSVTAVMTALLLQASPPVPTKRLGDAMHLSPLEWPVLGLCLLVPFYWTVEHICTARDLRLDNSLAQALALTFAAALWGEAHNTTPLVIEMAAALLVLTLFARGIWQLNQARSPK